MSSSAEPRFRCTDIYRTNGLYRIIFKADIQNPVEKTKKSSARTLKFLGIFGSINVRTSRFPFVRSKVYSSLFTRTETKINDIWFWFPRNEPRSLKDILNFASTSTFQSSNKGWVDGPPCTISFNIACLTKLMTYKIM